MAILKFWLSLAFQLAGLLSFDSNYFFLYKTTIVKQPRQQQHTTRKMKNSKEESRQSCTLIITNFKRFSGFDMARSLNSIRNRLFVTVNILRRSIYSLAAEEVEFVLVAAGWSDPAAVLCVFNSVFLVCSCLSLGL